MENQDQTTSQSQPSVPLQPSAHSSHPMKMFVKGLIVVAVIAVIGIGGYILGTQKQKPQVVGYPTPVVQETPIPTQDETASWKTYTNTKYKFTLKYPANFIVSETDFSTIKDLHPKNKIEFRFDFANNPDFKNKLLLSKDKSVLYGSVDIWKTNEQSITKALTEYHTFFGEDNLPNGVNRMINDITWLHRNYTNSSFVPITQYALFRENQLFVLETSPSDSQLKDTADQILSTFKFTQ